MRRLHFIFAVMLALSTPHLLADDHGRDDDERHALRVPSQFATIQDAVNAAKDGDTIRVAPGTYCEQVLIAKSNLRITRRDADEGRAPVLTNGCTSTTAGTGTGFKVLGTAAAPLSNVEISGFVVENFETGILLQYVVRSRVTANEVRHNERAGSATPGAQNGIMVYNSSYNEISGNYSHDNGHMGIAIRIANGNIVRGNRLVNNQTQYVGSCSLMIYGTSIGNQVVDNEVIDTVGNGIMVGPAGVQAQTLVAGNRVHGHAYAGIVVEPNSHPNLILENDVTGNGTSGVEPDLMDYDTTATNMWLRNSGTCKAGNAGC